MIAQIRILKSLYETHSSPILNGFSDEISSSTDECDFLKILSDEMFHLLEGLYNSVNQYFPNDDCIYTMILGNQAIQSVKYWNIMKIMLHLKINVNYISMVFNLRKGY